MCKSWPVWLLRVGVPGLEEWLGPPLASQGAGETLGGGQRLLSRRKTALPAAGTARCASGTPPALGVPGTLLTGSGGALVRG